MPDTTPDIFEVPTIQNVLERFAREHQKGSPGNRGRIVERVLFFLELCINNYGHRNLDENERDTCERHFRAKGSRQRDFFEVFGPEKLLPELDFFHEVYLRTEVQTTEQVEQKASSVVDQLCRWLVDEGYLDRETLAAERARALHRKSKMGRARRAKRRLEPLVARDRQRPRVRGADFVALDHHLVVRVEPGKVWLRVYRSAASERIGPVEVPLEVSELVEMGWSICAALQHCGRGWRIVELSEIYPRG